MTASNSKNHLPPPSFARKPLGQSEPPLRDFGQLPLRILLPAPAPAAPVVAVGGVLLRPFLTARLQRQYQERVGQGLDPGTAQVVNPRLLEWSPDNEQYTLELAQLAVPSGQEERARSLFARLMPAGVRGYDARICGERSRR